MYFRLFLSFTRNFFLIFFLFFLPSCAIKQNNKPKLGNLFLELPKNDLVFENMSSLVYDIFVEHYERVGYNLVFKSTDGYILRVIIKSLDPVYKYVSPDVVLFHSTIKLELLTQLLNYRKEIVAEKTFAITSLVSKPQNPILQSDFYNFEYRKLLKKAAPRVEQFYRKFLLNNRG